MNAMLWVVQGFLFFIFLFSGIMKATQPERKLVANGQTGVEGLSAPFIKFIGISEVMGAFGLMLPQLLKTMPALTPLAAACLGIIMIPAGIIHYKRGEKKTVFINIFILLLCVFVAYCRWQQL